MTGWQIRISFAAACILGVGYGGYRSTVRAAVSSGPAASRKSTAEHLRLEAPESLGTLRKNAGRLPLSPRAESRSWQMISSLGGPEISSALAELRQEPESPAMSLQVRMLLFRWAQIDPQAAAQAALKFPSPLEQPASAVLAAWMGQDVDAALAWANANGSTILKGKAARMAGRLFAQQEPSAAVAKAKSVSPRVLDATLSALSADMSGSGQGRTDFVALLASLPATSQLTALKGLVAGWSTQDPQAALTGIDSLGKGSPGEVEALRSTALLTWSGSDSRAALEWMADHSVTRTEQLKIYSYWAVGHPDEALPWLAQRNDPSFTAAAVKSNALDLIRNESLVEDESRAVSLGRLYALWSSTQPEEAAAWLDQLPADLHQKIYPHAVR